MEIIVAYGIVGVGIGVGVLEDGVIDSVAVGTGVSMITFVAVGSRGGVGVAAIVGLFVGVCVVV